MKPQGTTNGRSPVTCRAAALLLIAAAWANTASAQEITGVGWARAGTLAGLVVDATDAAVPRVKVVAANSDTGTIRETVTGGDGWFVMPLLPAGAYVITIERDGFSPLEVKNVPLDEAEYLVLRIPLRLGSVAESVTVDATWSALDLDARVLTPAVSHWVQGVRVGGELQRRLPFSTARGFADALLLAPGVISQASGKYVHGVAADASVVLIDGAEVSSSLVGGVDRLRLSTEAIEAVEVRTAGVDASVPLSQAAMISVVTRSGTNQARGSAGGVLQPRGWAAANPDFGFPTSHSLADAAIGGPVLRERAWFFGAYRGTYARSDLVIDPGQAEKLRALVPGWTMPEGGRGASQAPFVKVTSRLAPRHDFATFFQRDTTYGSPWSPVYVGQPARHLEGGNAYSARVSSVWSDTLMTRVSASYNDKTTGGQAAEGTSGPVVTVFRSVRPSWGVLAGSEQVAVLNPGADCCYTRPASKLTLTADLTWYREARGSHEIQVGIFSQPYLRAARVYAGGSDGRVSEYAVLRNLDDFGAGFVTYRRTFTPPGNTTMQDLRSQDEAIYLQDTWRVSGRFTIGAGLRVDSIRDHDKTSGLVARRTWAIGPRLSLVFQPTGRDVVRAGWGRIHETPTASRIETPPTVVVPYRTEYDMDLDGQFETVVDHSFVSSLVSDYLDLERGQPYVDELNLGYRRELPGNLMLDAGFVARGYHAIPIAYSGATLLMGGQLSTIRSGVDRITANTWNHPVVRDLTLQVTRQTAGLQLVASYNRNWRHVSGTWVPGDPASMFQPAAFANDAGIGGVRHAEANSLSGDADTDTEGWADHAGAVAASYIGPKGITFAGTYRVQSGPWTGPIVTMMGDGDPPTFPTTAVRFAYPTRGEGQLRLPTVHEMNVRIGLRRNTRWGRLEPAIDVYNVFNGTTFVTWNPLANNMSSESYGRPYRHQSPRSVSVSMRFVF